MKGKNATEIENIAILRNIIITVELLSKLRGISVCQKTKWPFNQYEVYISHFHKLTLKFYFSAMITILGYILSGF